MVVFSLGLIGVGVWKFSKYFYVGYFWGGIYILDFFC